MYKVEFSREAEKFILKQSVPTQKRIMKAIGDIAENPFEISNVKSLNGEYKGKVRKKVGSFRIIYELKHDKLIVYIFTVGNRGDIY